MPFSGTRKANSCFSGDRKTLTLTRANGTFQGENWVTEETLEEAVVREVWEETGISIVPGDIAGYVTFELPEKKVIAIVYDGGYVIADVKLSYEHLEYSWISLDAILEMDTLPAYFRDFFKRFVMENKGPSEPPI